MAARFGFFAAGKLKRVEVAGGAPTILCDAVTGRGGTWSRSGSILFAPSTRHAMFEIPATGGTPTGVTTIDVTLQQDSHRWPQFLPDGQHFFSFVRGGPRQGIHIGSLRSSTKTFLRGSNTNAVFANGPGGIGYMFVVHAGTLLA